MSEILDRRMAAEENYKYYETAQGRLFFDRLTAEEWGVFLLEHADVIREAYEARIKLDEFSAGPLESKKDQGRKTDKEKVVISRTDTVGAHIAHLMPEQVLSDWDKVTGLPDAAVFIQNILPRGDK